MAKQIQMTDEQKELYSELKKLAKRANQRILEIERFWGENSWGIRKLYERLDTDLYQAISQKGRIRVSKSFNEMQMRAIIKETKSFLEAKNISTIGGIKKTILQQKKAFKGKLDEATDKEINDLYDSLRDTDVTWLLKYMTPSELMAVESEAKEKPDDINEWLDRLEQVVDWENDIEAKQRLVIIWEKYIRE